MLNQVKLTDGLKLLALYGDEASAVTALVDAFLYYFADMESGGIPVVPAGVEATQAAFAGALSGMSASGAGAAKIQAALQAFWAALVPAVCWPGALAIVPPPGLSGVASGLSGVFASVVSANKTKDEAASLVAGVIHPAMAGGVVNFPPPPGGAGPQPIL